MDDSMNAFESIKSDFNRYLEISGGDRQAAATLALAGQVAALTAHISVLREHASDLNRKTPALPSVRTVGSRVTGR